MKLRALTLLGQILGLAVCYAVIGKIGLSFAIPPGYATAIFPASGLAMGALLVFGPRLWPGIWIGSFALNLWVTAESHTLEIGPVTFILSFFIATGTALQALTGRWLLIRFQAYPNDLVNGWDVTKFFTLAATLSPFVSATFGVTALSTLGFVDQSAFIANWWAWWLGDALGISVVTPFILILFDKPRELWGGRLLPVGVPLIVAFAALSMIYLFFAENQETNFQLRFKRRTAFARSTVEHAFAEDIDAVKSLEGLFLALPSPSDAQFERYTSHLLRRHQGIDSLAWHRREPNGNFKTTFIAPRDTRDFKLGATNAIGPQTLLQNTCETGQVAANRLENDINVIFPVFMDGRVSCSNLRGFLSARLRIDQILKPVMTQLLTAGIGMQLFDAVDINTPPLIDIAPPGYTLSNETVWEKSPVEVAGHIFMIYFSPTPLFFAMRTGWTTWGLTTVGVFLCGLLGAFLLVISGRRLSISRQVEARTRDLKRTAELLTAEISVRTQAEERLQRSREELEFRVRERTAELERLNNELARSNADLDQFASIASHDMKEPLRMVRMYLQLLEQGYKEKLGADAKEFIHYAVDGAARMNALIENLLTYARLGTRAQAFTETDCEAVFNNCLKDLQLGIEENQAVVTHDALPIVFGDTTQIRQLFQNLLSNSLKFRSKQTPRIHVSAKRADDNWIFSVHDNGLGIRPENAERIFVLFQRFPQNPQLPGMGIGLAMCKRIVERHGGRIWVESAVDQGATFFFTLPVLTPHRAFRRSLSDSPQSSTAIPS